MLCKELELALRVAGSFRVAERHDLEPLWFMTLSALNGLPKTARRQARLPHSRSLLLPGRER